MTNMKLPQTLDDMVTRLFSVKPWQGSAHVLLPDRCVIKMISSKTKRRIVRQQNMKYIEYFCRKEENRRGKFLGKPDMKVPRADMIAAIELFSTSGSGRCGRPGRWCEIMLMMDAQNRSNPADKALENAVCDSCSSSSYIRPGFFGRQVQDTAALTKFRLLQAKPGTGEKILAVVNKSIENSGQMMHGRKAADAAVISAPCSSSRGVFMPYYLFAEGVYQLCP